MRPDWFPSWTGETIIVIASGPSASVNDYRAACGRARIIAVNDSWKLHPDSDILLAGDYVWWHQNAGCPNFAGLKVSMDRRACETSEWNIKRLRGHRADQRVSFKAGLVNGVNSGFQAFCLAAQMKPRAILLCGFDMRVDYGVHWHGAHPPEMKNPDPDRVSRWRLFLDNAAKPIADRGIRVINCSAISTLKRYERMHFSDALGATCRAPV